MTHDSTCWGVVEGGAISRRHVTARVRCVAGDGGEAEKQDGRHHEALFRGWS